MYSSFQMRGNDEHYDKNKRNGIGIWQLGSPEVPKEDPNQIVIKYMLEYITGP